MKCLISILSTIILLSCSSDSVTNSVNLVPMLQEITSTENVLITGETILLNTSAIDANNDDLTFVWSSEGGQFSDQVDVNVQTSVKWTAPQERGIYTILCTVSDGVETDIGIFILDVVTIPSLVFIESGNFDMGNNFEEGEDDELPVHTVFLDAYSIGKYEVTNEQFAGFLNDTINDIEFNTPWYDIGDPDAKIRLVSGKFTPVFGFEDHPVAWVTWFGARAYGNWLSEKTGDTYRLPTEAEWEKAARGGNQLNQALGHQRKYPWGDTIEGEIGNYGNNGNPFDTDILASPLETSPVGYYDGTVRDGFQTRDNSSPYGAFDMASNVSEWCLERYFSGYYAESPSSNPMGVLFGTSMVVRGGTGVSSLGIDTTVIINGTSVTIKTLDSIRSANRGGGFEATRISSLGFRVLRTN